jgi:hypothetical protein
MASLTKFICVLWAWCHNYIIRYRGIWHHEPKRRVVAAPVGKSNRRAATHHLPLGMAGITMALTARTPMSRVIPVAAEPGGNSPLPEVSIF